MMFENDIRVYRDIKDKIMQQIPKDFSAVDMSALFGPLYAETIHSYDSDKLSKKNFSLASICSLIILLAEMEKDHGFIKNVRDELNRLLDRMNNES